MSERMYSRVLETYVGCTRLLMILCEAHIHQKHHWTVNASVKQILYHEYGMMCLIILTEMYSRAFQEVTKEACFGYWTYSFYTVIWGNCGEKLLCTTYKYLSLHWAREVWNMQRAELHILYILTEWSSYVYILNMDCISSVLEQNEVAMVTVIFILKMLLFWVF